MRTLTALFFASWLSGCGDSDHGYIVEGIVVEKTSPTEIVVDHQEVKGLMGAMVMPFDAKDPAMFAEIQPGDRIAAKLVIEQDGSWITKIRVHGHGAVPKRAIQEAAASALPTIRPGQAFPPLELPVVTGGTVKVGTGQDKPTVITFQYTSCPLPEFCPATTARLQSLQAELGTEARLVSVTIDPKGDTVEVLTDYASEAGAKPESWVFVRVEGADLKRIAEYSGLGFTEQDDEIVHGIRWMVLAADGSLIERYDDNNLPLKRVAAQLRTGGPLPVPGSGNGTVTPKPGTPGTTP